MLKFICVTCLSLAGLLIAIMPLSEYVESQRLPRIKHKSKAFLAIILMLSIGWLIVNGIFNVFPLLEYRLMDFDFYVHLQGSLWVPLTAVVFGCLGHFMEKRHRRYFFLLPILCIIFTIKYHWHYVVPPALYSSAETAGKNNFCYQTTPKSCGAASLVNLLALYEIDSTEGEMASLAEFSPQRGISYQQAVYALKRKFSNDSFRVELLLDPLSQKEPFMTSIRLNSGMAHMIVVRRISFENVEVMDPMKGPRILTMAEFQRVWRGGGIVLKGTQTNSAISAISSVY